MWLWLKQSGSVQAQTLNYANDFEGLKCYTITIRIHSWFLTIERSFSFGCDIKNYLQSMFKVFHADALHRIFLLD